MLTTDVAAAFAAYLTHLNEQDPLFIRDHCNKRIEVHNPALDVIVPEAAAPYSASFLGIINGFLDSINQPRVAYVEGEDGAILGFRPLESTFVTVVLESGLTLEVARDLPSDELDILKAFIADPELDFLVSNYDLRITKLPEGVDILLIVAEGVPLEEVDQLQVRFERAMAVPHVPLVVNYEVNLTGRAPV